MSLFSIAIMLNSQSLFCIAKLSKVVENSNSIQARQQYLRCNNTKFQLKIPIFFGYAKTFPRVSYFFAYFTIGMIGNEMGHLLKYVMLYGKSINKSETLAHVEKKCCCYFA